MTDGLLSITVLGLSAEARGTVSVLSLTVIVLAFIAPYVIRRLRL